MRLRITMVRTIAKTLENSILLFALDKSAPMLPVGLQMTSAATPDFQANPRPDIQEFRSAGKSTGSLILITISFRFIPITDAISINFLSTDIRLFSTCIHTIGNTIRKEIKEGIAVVGIQSHARTINAATGTERISRETGAVKLLKNKLFPDKRPQRRPNITASTKPLTI